MKYVRCGANQSIYEAVAEHFGDGFHPVANGIGRKHPEAAGMVGEVTVRQGESFAVVPDREVQQQRLESFVDMVRDLSSRPFVRF